MDGPQPPFAALALSEFINYAPGSVVSKVIVKSPRMNVTLFCMAAGTDIEEHTTTREGTVHVIEGDGVFVLDGVPIPMLDGVLIHMAANQKHSIVTGNDTSFLLTLVG